MTEALKPAVLPRAPLFRVHPSPRLLPALPPAGEPGRNRWDDPLGEYRVRYAATNLRGSMVELLARFQDSAEAEGVLAQVEGVDEVDGPDYSKLDGVEEWLSRQHVGCLEPAGDPLIIDIDHAEFLVELDKNHYVRAALDASPLSSPGNAAHLDFAIIRLTAPLGRPITQSVSRAIHEDYPAVGGIRYSSRIDTSEECWALYDETEVRWVGDYDHELSPRQREHFDAVCSAAQLLQISLPPEWR
jgi:hypothetical protein